MHWSCKGSGMFHLAQECCWAASPPLGTVAHGAHQGCLFANTPGTTKYAMPIHHHKGEDGHQKGDRHHPCHTQMEHVCDCRTAHASMDTTNLPLDANISLGSKHSYLLTSTPLPCPEGYILLQVWKSHHILLSCMLQLYCGQGMVGLSRQAV